jgi:RHS repeat-associated protein
MNGTTIKPTEGYLRAVADLTWQIAALGDYDGDGKADIFWRNGQDLQPSREYVYLGDIPVAVIPDGASPSYIHVDHLNTPRLIADAQQRVVWRWDQQEPFGVNVPDENPSGLGAFEFPMRFPGQYADKETNLHYNYFRDYDPAIGRYLRTDPIGLGAGMNLYAYVWQSPVMFFDSFGLECWWLDLGNAVKCAPTGLRRQKPTKPYQAKQWFPAPDPTSPTLGVGPIPPMPEPGMKLVWRTVFREQGYWEAELDCKVWAVYVCKECGKLTYLPGNKALGKKWEKETGSDYDDVTGYGSWTNVTAPPGPQDLDFGGGGWPQQPRPGVRLR